MAAVQLKAVPLRRELELLAQRGRVGLEPTAQPAPVTEETASVHVSRILTKLGVAGRGEAAAVAHRLGLDRQ